MKKSVKKKLEKILDKLPSPKLLFGLIVAVLLSAIIYLLVLCLLNR